jgi:hypothetical protein
LHVGVDHGHPAALAASWAARLELVLLLPVPLCLLDVAHGVTVT